MRRRSTTGAGGTERLLSVKPPSLWLAGLYGLAGAGAVAVFVAFFATRLRDIYFAISTLVFSQMLRDGVSRFFTEYYLIPVGILFILMVIFLPQGLFGFLRRPLNR